jgi:hypothetical protein
VNVEGTRTALRIVGEGYVIPDLGSVRVSASLGERRIDSILDASLRPLCDIQVGVFGRSWERVFNFRRVVGTQAEALVYGL